MWIRRSTVELLERENERKTGEIVTLNHRLADQVVIVAELRTRIERGTKDLYQLHGEWTEIKAQQARDQLTNDWLRNRVNALEKERSILLQKIAGVAFPTPEIVLTPPKRVTDLPDFDYMPSFEDMGETEATRQGIEHNEEGELVYKRK